MVAGALCLVAGSSLGLLVVPRAPSSEDAPTSTITAEYLDQPIQLDGEAQKQMLTRARELLARNFTLILPDGKRKELPLSKWGGRVDSDRLSSLLIDLRDASSPTRRLMADAPSTKKSEHSSNPPFALPSALSLDPELCVSELMRIKDRVDRPAQDARLDFKKKTVIEHQTGHWLDVDATLLGMEEALQEGKLSAEATIIERAPEKRSSDIRDLKFDAVLGHFETGYSRSQKAADRTFNLRLAAERLDGTVVLPGETFDFNAVVGPRDEAAGYKVATVIEDGELVDGIGGGTCQISGTLHGAVFFAGLELVERYPHTRPSSYIKMGMDATVVYPTINFRFRNSYKFAVAVHQTVENGIVRAEILGERQDQVVTLIRKIDRAIPYEQIEREDPTLPKGTSILAQRGVPGFRLHRYRTVRKGSHTLRERWRDIYPPTNQVIRVGSGGPDRPTRSGVATPEYLADEVLILTQRRPVGGDPGELAENRVQGRYGERGWTRKEGMPFWDRD